MKRVFLIVLDSFGIGQMPDAEKFGDYGVDTLGTVSKSPYFLCQTWKNWDFSDRRHIGRK